MTQKWNLQDIRPTEPRPVRRVPEQSTVVRPLSTTNSSSHTHIQSPRGRMQGDMRTPMRDTEAPRDDIDLSLDDEADQTIIPIINGKKNTRRHVVIAIALFVLITTIGIVISSVTGGATVTIEPKSREINVNAEFTAYKEQKPEELTYEIMTLDASSERQVEASGQEDVKIQATGEIEISKSTPGAERLIKNTRFATADGLIFRIEESVVVPGSLTDSSGKSVPGTIRAKVFADEAGDKYNLAAGTTLSVPGFKEGDYMDLYNAISAKNTAAFTNGFAGPKFIINQEQLATARQSLQAELRDTLLGRIDKEKPANFTTFKGSVAITYNELPAVQYGDKLVTIKEQAVLQMPLFKTEDFASFIAKETIVGYDNDPVRINNLDSLNFIYSSATTSSSNIANESALTFKITGTPLIVWTFDEGKLKLDLLGKEKTAIPQILGSYPGIEKSEVKIRPIWKRSMPTDQTDITVTEVLSTK
jgi:hypothetical protein